jgi:putative peptidoglycan lipid II flippase
MDEPVEVDNSSITKPASRVMFGGVLALFAGLASNIIVAYIFGAGSSMDAYLTAIVIPSYLQIVFFSSLSFVVIPAFIEAKAKNQDEDAWGLVGTFFWITLIVLSLIAVLGSVFSQPLIRLVVPGFQSTKSALASQMLAISIFTMPFIGLSTLTTAIQNARHRFFWPSFAPAFGSMTNVIVLLIFSRILGPLALCWGYLLSAMVQSGFTIIPIVFHGWKKLIPLSDIRVKNIGKLMTPLLLFGIVTCLSPVALRYFSSNLPNGQIAYMGYANKISGIFVLLIASGIAASIFPSMARSYSKDGIQGLSQKSDFGLCLTFAVALPAILIVGAVAFPLIRIFFERGAFTRSDTYGVENILFAYLLGDVLFRMLGNIFDRAFYALKNTITPMVISCIFVILFIASAHFVVTRWGYVGLVWALITSQGLDPLTAGILVYRKYPKGHGMKLATSILKYFLAAFASFICARFVLFILADFSIYIQLGIGLLSGGLVYFLILLFIDKEMLTSIVELFGIHYDFRKLKLDFKVVGKENLERIRRVGDDKTDL